MAPHGVVLSILGCYPEQNYMLNTMGIVKWLVDSVKIEKMILRLILDPKIGTSRRLKSERLVGIAGSFCCHVQFSKFAQCRAFPAALPSHRCRDLQVRWCLKIANMVTEECSTSLGNYMILYDCIYIYVYIHVTSWMMMDDDGWWWMMMDDDGRWMKKKVKKHWKYNFQKLLGMVWGP